MENILAELDCASIFLITNNNWDYTYIYIYTHTHTHILEKLSKNKNDCVNSPFCRSYTGKYQCSWNLVSTSGANDKHRQTTSTGPRIFIAET
jgi:hypothetical protein